jgi:hypothetical protein
MMKRLAFPVFAATVVLSFSLSALGQQSKPIVVGKLKDVQGLVTVTSGNTLTNAVSEADLVSGTRIVTTASGEVTLAFFVGCDIKLKPLQTITVKDGLDCAALLASVQPVGILPPAADGASNLVVALGVGGALLVVGTINRGNSVSPN